MLAIHDPRRTIDYVRVGLFAQAVLEELFAIVDNQGKLPKQMPSIQRAIESLKDVDNLGGVSGLDLAFRTYEAEATLREVLRAYQSGSMQPKDLRELLQGSLSPNISPDDRVVLVNKGVSFFTKLAQQAVVNTQFPHDDIPPGVRELARQVTA